jgi:hypothetical protein
MTLTFRGKDIGWISGLLQDVGVLWDDVRHDPVAQILTIGVARPRYEAPTHRQLMGVVPVVRYQTVPALLVVPSVTATSTLWQYEWGKDPTYTHTLIELSANDRQFVMETDVATLEASLSAPAEMELRDIGAPSLKTRAFDLLTPVSRFRTWAHELDRLRSDALQREDRGA